MAGPMGGAALHRRSMSLARTYDLKPGEAAKRIEIRLEGTRLTQHRLGHDDEWTESEGTFSNHLEAREAFDQLVFVYGKKGQLVAQEDDAGPAQLSVSGAAGHSEVVADWLLEEGPRLLGEELFSLYRSGGLPLAFEGQRLVEATISNVSVPTAQRLASRHVHHPHFLMEALLRQPVAQTIERLRFVELDRADAERAVPGELAAAVRAAVRSPVGPALRVLEAGDFDRMGEGKPLLKEVARCGRLQALRLVFQKGFSWAPIASDALERLEVGVFSARAQLVPIESAAFPRLHTLAVGVTRAANLLPALAPLVETERFPALKRLAIHVRRTGEFTVDGAEAIRADSEGAFARLVTSSLFPTLESFAFEGPLHASTVSRHRAALSGLSKLRLYVLGGDPDALRLELPRLQLSR